MAPDLLDPAALTASLPNLLPHNRKKVESQQDAITALVHTSFHALSFRLVAVDDSTPASIILEGVLPDSWNSHGPGSYTLRYRHEQSSLEFVVKVVKLGSRTLINGIAVESDKTASLDIATNDFTSPSFFPFDAQAANPPPLIHGYISSNRVADFLDQLKLKIIQNLMPGLHKEGYTEGPPATSPPSSLLMGPERIFGEPSSRNPLEIGRRDLDPLGINPLGGFGPPPLFPGSGGDGMFVGPNHPIFGQPPPGARFDPVGPGLGPFPGRTGFGPRGGQPGGGNVGDPDNDEFMPPGAGDMFM
ncbi:PI31 proteasome regulator N-terminal-domain-containing protein [Lactarius akahatsu]|uniref:PI31 proteasome regulator N-terminal-domain-containing protein n=1 Tax=Lactarius akahatsu TaxID=416441 RepID=A0AAD4LEE1_9AGAM|nr:PI31 proteasome regulator N-terminal-domain-containing protein [Lactarius akahatsu]